MKNIVVLDCGPSLKEVSKKFGQSPEWVMATLKNLGINFNWVKLHTGERIDKYKGDAWIITGSPQSVNDEESWMLNLEDNIRDAAEIKKSILGICFGHQLIAKSFGGKVEINPQGWELGSYPIYLTADGTSSPLFQGIDGVTIVYESHQDSVIELPANAIELASNKKGIQAFTLYDTLYAVQFHPEFSLEVMKKYVAIRGAAGIPVDDPIVPKSTHSHLVLHNFINII